MEKKMYPFTAIVGQEDMKLALILNLINPALGGVLIRGEKGTAKSTAVRGLCNLMDDVDVVEGCPFHCRPGVQPLCRDCAEKTQPKTRSYTRKVVELPISATEDRVVGALNIEQAIKKGEKVFEPGILAEANGNILYVDEINLLDDHIVDVLLDSAAMGVNTVEREGVSYSHPARFVLVGTMNPEELVLITQSMKEVNQIMEAYVGIVRSNIRLIRAWNRLDILYEETEKLFKRSKASREICELRNIINVGYLIMRQAKERKESRGLHFTIDYPPKQQKN